MMFVTRGGGFDAVSKRTSRHADVPHVSDERVCIRRCGPEPREDETTTEVVLPGAHTYTLHIRITDLAQGFRTPARGTPEFKELADRVSAALGAELGRVKGYREVVLDGFVQ